MVTQADGTAERDAGLVMMHRKWRRNRRWKPEAAMTLGADKAYNTRDFVATLEALGVEPHVAQNLNRAGGGVAQARGRRLASRRGCLRSEVQQLILNLGGDSNSPTVTA